jgi:hypothetical protein
MNSSLAWNLLKSTGSEQSLALLVSASLRHHVLLKFNCEWDESSEECADVRATRLFPSEAPKFEGLEHISHAADMHPHWTYVCSQDAENELDGTITKYILLESLEDDGVGLYALVTANLANNSFRAVSSFQVHHHGGLAKDGAVRILDGPLVVFTSQGTSSSASLFVADCRKAKASVFELESQAAPFTLPSWLSLQVTSVVCDPHVSPQPHLLLRTVRTGVFETDDCQVCHAPKFAWQCLLVRDIMRLVNEASSDLVVLETFLKPCVYIPPGTFSCSPYATANFVPSIDSMEPLAYRCAFDSSGG